MPPYTIPYRILKYLREEQPGDFTAADIASRFNLGSRGVSWHLRNVPGVFVKHKRSDGYVYGWKEPGWQ